jgi:hypothetical protein
MRYRVTRDGDVEVLELEPRVPESDFPYRDYPSLLPYVPLDCEEPAPLDLERFSSKLPHAVAPSGAPIVVAVPPPADLGVSLWGRWGDLEGVTIVFECEPSSREVSASTVCS